MGVEDNFVNSIFNKDFILKGVLHAHRERERELETEREFIRLLVHSLDGQNSQIQREWVAEVQTLEPSSSAFPGPLVCTSSELGRAIETYSSK